MKSIVIDKSKWRCGGSVKDKHARGKGSVRLLNNEGFMCCLGQMCQQIAPELPIIGLLSPSETNQVVEGLAYPNSYGEIMNTGFSCSAMFINDCCEHDDEKREKHLREVGLEHGFDITFVGEFADA